MALFKSGFELIVMSNYEPIGLAGCSEEFFRYWFIRRPYLRRCVVDGIADTKHFRGYVSGVAPGAYFRQAQQASRFEISM